MTQINRRLMLGGIAATAGGVIATVLPLPIPTGTAGGNDLGTVQALIDAHTAAMERYYNNPDEEIPDDVVAEMMTTGAALCAYRPATIESVHIKAKYMMTCFVFVGGDKGDPDFTHAQLVSGFLPAGREV